MSKLEQLVIRRAELLRQIKALKSDSSSKSCLVAYSNTIHQMTLLSISNAITETCIERVYREVRDSDDYSYDKIGFDEAFENTGTEPCQHCKDVRQNKKQRMELRREFGGVNAQITKIGNRLIEARDSENE